MSNIHLLPTSRRASVTLSDGQIFSIELYTVPELNAESDEQLIDRIFENCRLDENPPQYRFRDYQLLFLGAQVLRPFGRRHLLIYYIPVIPPVTMVGRVVGTARAVAGAAGTVSTTAGTLASVAESVTSAFRSVSATARSLSEGEDGIDRASLGVVAMGALATLFVFGIVRGRRRSG